MHKILNLFALLFLKTAPIRGCPGGPVVGTSHPNAGGAVSMLGQGAKILHASWPKTQKNIRRKQYCNKFLKILFFNIYIYIYFFGCAGSSLLDESFSCGEQGLLLVAVHRLSLQRLLLCQCTGPRHLGFSSCNSRVLKCRLSSGGAWA